MKKHKKISLLILLFTCILILNNLFAQKKSYLSFDSFKELRYNSYLTTANAGILYSDGKKMFGGGEIHLYKFWDQDYSSLGFGYSVVFQRKLIERKKTQLFLETKGGVIYMFPENERTAVNFTFFLVQHSRSI